MLNANNGKNNDIKFGPYASSNELIKGLKAYMQPPTQDTTTVIFIKFSSKNIEYEAKTNLIIIIILYAKYAFGIR